MKLITTKRGYAAKVDDDDYERLAEYTYYPSIKRRKDGTTNIYLLRNVKIDGRTYTQRLHHDVLMGKPLPGLETDHEDGDGLNCQRYNLRVVENFQNQANKRSWGRTSRFKGVSLYQGNRWHAQIMLNGKNIYLGRFPLDQEEAAARAYDRKARELFGEFAKTNFPD